MILTNTHNLFWAEIWKISVFLSENFQFFGGEIFYTFEWAYLSKCSSIFIYNLRVINFIWFDFRSIHNKCFHRQNKKTCPRIIQKYSSLSSLLTCTCTLKNLFLSLCHSTLIYNEHHCLMSRWHFTLSSSSDRVIIVSWLFAHPVTSVIHSLYA